MLHTPTLAETVRYSFPAALRARVVTPNQARHCRRRRDRRDAIGLTSMGIELETKTTKSSWSPLDATSGTKAFWHDPQDSATVAPGPAAAFWVDKFGNGWDVSQLTGAKQPTLSTAAFGGKQSLQFLSANAQELILVDSTKVTGLVGGTDVPYVVYLVVQMATVALNVIVGFDSTTVAARYSLCGTQAAGSPFLYQRNDGGAAIISPQTGLLPIATKPYLCRFGYTGTDAAWKVNGTTLTSSVAANNGAMVINRLIYGAYGNGAGAHSAFAHMFLGDVIAFSGVAALSAGEEALLEAYLKDKWDDTFT